MKSYTNDFAGDDYDQFIQSAIGFGLAITFRKGPNVGYPEFTVSGEGDDINDWRAVTGFDDGLPFDGEDDDSTIRESGLSRYSIGGKISSGGNTAKGLIGHGDLRNYGASNIDFFGSYLIDEIKANLENLTANVDGKNRNIIDMSLTDITIDKDPESTESVKVRKLRAHVYFKYNLNRFFDEKNIIKQKVLNAFQGGKVDFNDKYKNSHLVIKDMLSISKSFKYGNDEKSMYFVFKIYEEEFHNEKPTIIVHKRGKDNITESLDEVAITNMDDLGYYFYNGRVIAKGTGPFGEDKPNEVVAFGKIGDADVNGSINVDYEDEGYDSLEEWFEDFEGTEVIVLEDTIGQGNNNFYDLSGCDISDLSLYGEEKSIRENTHIEESHIQGTCPICGEAIWSDEGVSLNVNGDWCHSYCVEVED